MSEAQTTADKPIDRAVALQWRDALADVTERLDDTLSDATGSSDELSPSHVEMARVHGSLRMLGQWMDTVLGTDPKPSDPTERTEPCERS